LQLAFLMLPTKITFRSNFVKVINWNTVFPSNTIKTTFLMTS